MQIIEATFTVTGLLTVWAGGLLVGVVSRLTRTHERG